MTKTDSANTTAWSVRHLKSPVDGTSIRFATSGDEDAEYGILFLNGRSEWIEKYSFLPDKIALGPNFRWAMMDHRGQGSSEGTRAHVQSYDDYVEDTAAVAEQVFGSRPYAIVSHSMGGLIAIYGSLKGKLKPRLMFLSSPLFGIDPPMPIQLARPLAKILAGSRLSQMPSGAGSDSRRFFPDNPLTSSYAGFQAVQRSPYTRSTPSFGWIAATFRAFDTIFDPESVKNLPCPVRIVVGNDERVVDTKPYSAWVRLAHEKSAKHVEWKRLGFGRHELLNEVSSVQNVIWNDIRSWFRINGFM